MTTVCKSPYIRAGFAFGCGRCEACRFRQAKVWAHRIILESTLHSENCFVTLSYDDEHLPEGGNLEPRDLQLFMKRLRKEWEPRKIRFYGSGEYGEKGNRPHYHVILFGLPTCDRGRTDARHNFKQRRGACCAACSRMRDVWGNGHVYLGTVQPAVCHYVASYITKANFDEGRIPPFARMSNRPGLGLGVMDDVASSLMEYGIEEQLLDVPMVLRHGKHIWPLGRYLRVALRKRLGRSEKAPEGVYKAWDEAMQPLRAYAKKIAPRFQYEATLRGVVQDVMEGKRIRVEAQARRKVK